MYLYRKDYSEEIVLAGFLHDILEWTTSSEEMIINKFGKGVHDIVKANTKDRTIEDPAQRRREYINRCIQSGEGALIVKVADLLDSYHFYRSAGDLEETMRCIDMAAVIIEKLPNYFRDSIFEELKSVK